jgi:hypothetical protein
MYESQRAKKNCGKVCAWGGGGGRVREFYKDTVHHKKQRNFLSPSVLSPLLFSLPQKYNKSIRNKNTKELLSKCCGPGSGVGYETFCRIQS